MAGWELPRTAEIRGKLVSIQTDYRDILEIIEMLSDETVPLPVRWEIAGCLFCDDFDKLSQDEKSDLLNFMVNFINGGEAVSDDARYPKRIDWKQDRQLIISDINRVAGKEIRAEPYMHWWTFLAWFGAIGEGRLSTVVAIREKLRKGQKLDKWERDYYNENRKVIDFQRHYTGEEDELIRQWTGGEINI